MASGSNPPPHSGGGYMDINSFLQSFQQDPDRIGRFSVGGGQLSAPPPRAVLLFNADYCGDGDDSYVVASAPSDASSDSTSRQTSRPSIVFTHRTYGSSVTSSIPPRHAPHLSFVHTLNATNPTFAQSLPPLDYSQPNILWCEYCMFEECNRVFALDETDEWIDHHCDHMQDTFPAVLSCWFCDDVQFVAANGRDHRARFHARMVHIREHISLGTLTADNVRPDFHMIEHMRREGLISDGPFYHAAMGYSELPEALRLPGSRASPSATPRTMPSTAEGRLPPLRHNLYRETRPSKTKRPNHS